MRVRFFNIHNMNLSLAFSLTGLSDIQQKLREDVNICSGARAGTDLSDFRDGYSFLQRLLFN